MSAKMGALKKGLTLLSSFGWMLSPALFGILLRLNGSVPLTYGAIVELGFKEAKHVQSKKFSSSGGFPG